MSEGKNNPLNVDDQKKRSVIRDESGLSQLMTQMTKKIEKRDKKICRFCGSSISKDLTMEIAIEELREMCKKYIPKKKHFRFGELIGEMKKHVK